MKAKLWASCFLAGGATCALAGDVETSIPSFIEVVVQYSELRGQCAGDRFAVAIFDMGDGRRSGLIADERGKVLYQGASVHAEGCGADQWLSRTDAYEKLGAHPSDGAITQLIIASSTSNTCHIALDLPEIVGPLCSPPNPGHIR